MVKLFLLSLLILMAESTRESQPYASALRSERNQPTVPPLQVDVEAEPALKHVAALTFALQQLGEEKVNNNNNATSPMMRDELVSMCGMPFLLHRTMTMLCFSERLLRNVTTPWRSSFAHY